MKILIAGAPRTGKSTFAAQLSMQHGLPVLHTDDLIGSTDWSGASLEVMKWIEDNDHCIIEGVVVARALRKWLVNNEGSPADILYNLTEAKVEQTPGQITMAKGCGTVFAEIVQELLVRGCEVDIDPEFQR